MASKTSYPFNSKQEWFLQTDTSFEWTEWWAEVENSFLQEPVPEATHALLQLGTRSSFEESSRPPAVSPASTDTSDRFPPETHDNASEQDETISKAKKRKIQNREAQRKCRDRRREQVLNLGERLRTSMAENKNLQARQAKLEEECNRLKSENGIYCELLQNFWTMTFSEDKPAALASEQEGSLPEL
ncbi:hypothetical protein M409DRAFT_21378 [Zasmidium cellare ATCC 36951]|uniref:BZIP domain-containing protein n=1 Tax=Zasmidium cellare ATCC 36951 TaxID=1080233 RepID=A0A6A6CND5_ZASCE|nr:uncharacterized protein M409DRAFT_21378 [Zasmidium cellare ATCC 36951]KAF2168634.1 hypothetical protein M409DRAFT_21378 [Zasmidium cellare ATCC 36951]